MSLSQNSASLRFGVFELHPQERLLLASEQRIVIGPRAFDLLVALVQSGGRLVSKDELFAKVWPKVVVEENSLHAQISALRKILGVDAIVTVSKSGYRFTLAVTVVEAAPTPQKHNLPQFQTSFVGREKELIELRRLLGTTRLLTLIGAGGCGKTRLACRLGAELSGYVDGIWLVELAGLRDGDLVAEVVANVLGIQPTPDKTLIKSITDHVESRKLLLVLDNAEHLLSSSAALADAILKHAEGATVLVTSREPLRLKSEQTYRVPSLAVPEAQHIKTPEQVVACESVQLFIERARLQRPHFVVTDNNAAVLASVCRRLDGIPLAIELAAPRLRSMTLEELDRRLDHHLGLLTSGANLAQPRHRTLRSMLDWSFDLLAPSERAVLCRVSVFAAGWELDAAERICEDDRIGPSEVVDLLASLVDKSLVSVDERAGVMRYRLLETVRQYAAERLQESSPGGRWQDRHVEFFAALSEQAEPHLHGEEAKTWLDRLEVEHDNSRAALAWACGPSGVTAAGLRLAAAQWHFWFLRGHVQEGRRWISALLAVEDVVDGPIRGNVLAGAGMLAYIAGDLSAARKVWDECLTTRRKLGDASGTADVLCDVGAINLAQDGADLTPSNLLFVEALAIFREASNLKGIGKATRYIGLIAARQRNFGMARAHFEDSLAAYGELGRAGHMAAVLLDLTNLAVSQDDLVLAKQWLISALKSSGSISYLVGIELRMLIVTDMARSDTRLAICAAGAGERLHEDIGVVIAETELQDLQRRMDLARETLGGEAFDLARREGRSWGWQHAVQQVLASEGA